MKKIIMICTISLVTIVGLCWGTIWYLNKDKSASNNNNSNNNVKDIVNDRFTPFKNESTEVTYVENIASCLFLKEEYNYEEEYPSKLHIKNGKVYFDYIFDFKSVEAKGINGKAKKIMYIGYSGGGYETYAVLTEEGEVYIFINNYIDCDEEKVGTFVKVETSSKVLDITSREDLISVPCYPAGILYVYLETEELRKVDISIESDKINTSIGKRWGELFPHLDSVFLYTNEEEFKVFYIYDDKSINIYDYDKAKAIYLTYNNKKIQVNYIYTKFDVKDGFVYITDSENNLFKIENRIDFSKDTYELIKIDSYDKIEKLNDENALVFTKNNKKEKIEIDFDYYKFYIRNEYEFVVD